jgi:hypothetical protein
MEDEVPTRNRIMYDDRTGHGYGVNAVNGSKGFLDRKPLGKVEEGSNVCQV